MQPLELLLSTLPVSKLDAVKHGEFLVDLVRLLDSFHPVLDISQSRETTIALPFILYDLLSLTLATLREIAIIIIW